MFSPLPSLEQLAVLPEASVHRVLPSGKFQVLPRYQVAWAFADNACHRNQLSCLIACVDKSWCVQVQTSTPPHQLSACPFCKVMRQTGYLVKVRPCLYQSFYYVRHCGSYLVTVRYLAPGAPACAWECNSSLAASHPRCRAPATLSSSACTSKHPVHSSLTGRMCAASVQLVGAKTAEEKEQERVEEQKVIEARIREREVRILSHSCCPAQCGSGACPCRLLNVK